MARDLLECTPRGEYFTYPRGTDNNMLIFHLVRYSKKKNDSKVSLSIFHDNECVEFESVVFVLRCLLRVCTAYTLRSAE